MLRVPGGNTPLEERSDPLLHVCATFDVGDRVGGGTPTL
jgi:hypothetical protein